MGAYTNPQEIEGQFDLTQNQRSLQGLFNTVTAAAANASERIAREQQINAERVQSILNETQEKKAKLQVLVESAASKAKTGLNYDCYKEGIEEWNKLGNKSAFGAASPEDKRRRAQILASVDNFSGMAANTNDMVEQYDKASALIGEGGYDVKGSNPTMIRLLEGLKAKDGDVAQFSFRKDENGNNDYANEGFKVFAYKDKNGVEYPETFVSGQELERALNGNTPNGMVYKKSYAGDNKKIYDTFKIGENGMGIFEYDKNEPTGKVADNYLTDQPGAPIIVRKVQGGRWEQKTVKIDRAKIAAMIEEQAVAIADGSATVSNEVATKYNNYVAPFMNETTNPNFNKYKELEDFAKFVPIPGYDKAFPYNEGILTSDEEKLKAIRHNNKAAFMQTVKTEQVVGEPYFIADPKPTKTKKAAAGSKNTKATFDDAKKWVYRQKKGVVDDISFNGKNVTYDGKNFMVAKGPNQYEVFETYDEVINYLRPLKTPLK